MSQLLESILNQDYISANDLFNERMVELQEQKLYESKRMMQAEVFGRLSPKEIEDRKKSGYRKASEILGDPTKHRMKPLVKLKKKIVKDVKEAVDVQPDPEGRVRGGQARPAKGTMKRKVLAGVVKGVRKTARAAGVVGGEVAGRLGAAKDAWQKYKDEKAKASPFPADMHQAQSQPAKKKDDAVKNALKNMGKETWSNIKSAAASTWEE